MGEPRHIQYYNDNLRDGGAANTTKLLLYSRSKIPYSGRVFLQIQSSFPIHPGHSRALLCRLWSTHHFCCQSRVLLLLLLRTPIPPPLWVRFEADTVSWRAVCFEYSNFVESEDRVAFVMFACVRIRLTYWAVQKWTLSPT